MRIAGTSNFSDETFSEFFTDDVGTNKELQEICDKKNSDHSTVYFIVVDDDYKLFKWEP